MHIRYQPFLKAQFISMNTLNKQYFETKEIHKRNFKKSGWILWIVLFLVIAFSVYRELDSQIKQSKIANSNGNKPSENSIYHTNRNENKSTELILWGLQLDKEFEIENLRKSNEYPSSQIDTVECPNWSLTKDEAIQILKNAQLINGADWHNFYGHWSCCMNADLIQNEKTFEISINAGTWISITMNNETQYLGKLPEEYEKLFLSGEWTLDEMEK